MVGALRTTSVALVIVPKDKLDAILMLTFLILELAG